MTPQPKLRKTIRLAGALVWRGRFSAKRFKAGRARNPVADLRKGRRPIVLLMKLFSFEFFVLYQGVEEGAEGVILVFRLFDDLVDNCLITKTDGCSAKGDEESCWNFET